LNEMGIRGNAAIKKVRVKRKRKEKHGDFLKAEDSRIRYQNERYRGRDDSMDVKE